MTSRGIVEASGIQIGHYTDLQGATGCTVILAMDGAVAGVDVRGGAPGTRETDLLRPGNLVEKIHAVLLSGGSAFGLNAAAGVVRYLEEKGIGFEVGPVKVPIVAAAVLYDLGLVTHTARPDADGGYRACLSATDRTVEEGSVGAGTGATVGKALGMDRAVKGGVGTAAVRTGNGLTAGAIVAVNAFGGVVHPRTGRILAGPRGPSTGEFLDSVEVLLSQESSASAPTGANTTIGVVATDAKLTKEQVHHLARVSHDGLAMAIRPCHTIRDGDSMFALATGSSPVEADLTALGAAVVEAVSLSVVRAVASATGLGGTPSASEWKGSLE